SVAMKILLTLPLLALLLQLTLADEQARVKRDCNITGCLYCKGRGPYGDGCEFIYYDGCNATGCIRCTELGRGDGCEFVPVREKREEQTSSTNCVAHDGHEDCTICTNGVCHTTHSRKKRGSESYSKNCNNNRCTECINGSCRTYDE
ncbi:hypothetical protein PRIPAC_88107, partial [Pristionchus pacificus]|uniref:Uncharacterized protein n=1 Tax=Pristionchus pacificus TaxID=54126 RepID=A0A8R1Z5C6_PRIPA